MCLLGSENLRSQPLMGPIASGDNLNQPQCNCPPWLSSVNHQMNPSYYPSDQQVGRDQSLMPSDQMQANAFCMPGLPWMPPSWPTFFPSGGWLRPPYLLDYPYPLLYPSHSQNAPSNWVPSRVATLPPRDLSAGYPYASLGHPHQTSLEQQTTRTAEQLQENPPPMFPQNPLTPRVSAPSGQQRNVNPINTFSSNGMQMMVPDQHIPIPSAVNVPHPVLPALHPPRSARIERLSFPNLKSDDPQEFAMLNMALKNLLPSEETEQYKCYPQRRLSNTSTIFFWII